MTGDAVVAAARGWIGTPFAWGQSLKGVGCDCKGLIAGVARELGLTGADSFEADYAGYGTRVPSGDLKAGLARWLLPADAMHPGDVLLLNVRGRPQHLAIFAGTDERSGGRMIHAYSKGPMRVIEGPMGTVWARAVDSVWRWEGVNHGR